MIGKGEAGLDEEEIGSKFVRIGKNMLEFFISFLQNIYTCVCNWFLIFYLGIIYWQQIKQDNRIIENVSLYKRLCILFYFWAKSVSEVIQRLNEGGKGV